MICYTSSTIFIASHVTFSVGPSSMELHLEVSIYVEIADSHVLVIPFLRVKGPSYACIFKHFVSETPSFLMLYCPKSLLVRGLPEDLGLGEGVRGGGHLGLKPYREVLH